MSMQAAGMRCQWLASWLLWLALWLWPQAVAAQTAIPPLDSPVIDTVGVLDADSRERLIQQALRLQQSKGSQLQILIVSSTAPESIDQYAQRVFDHWQLGRKGVDDGVLLLLALKDRSYRIQTGYGLEGAIPDVISNRVSNEYLVPKLREGDVAGGAGGCQCATGAVD